MTDPVRFSALGSWPVVVVETMATGAIGAIMRAMEAVVAKGQWRE